MDKFFIFNKANEAENTKTGFIEEAGFYRLILFFRYRIYMFCVVRMKFFSKKVKKRKEKQENYDHEAQDNSNAIKHNDNSSLNCNYHNSVYMIFSEKISVELSILRRPSCPHGKSLRAYRLPKYRQCPFQKSLP